MLGPGRASPGRALWLLNWLSVVDFWDGVLSHCPPSPSPGPRVAISTAAGADESLLTLLVLCLPLTVSRSLQCHICRYLPHLAALCRTLPHSAAQLSSTSCCCISICGGLLFVVASCRSSARLCRTGPQYAAVTPHSAAALLHRTLQQRHILLTSAH